MMFLPCIRVTYFVVYHVHRAMGSVELVVLNAALQGLEKVGTYLLCDCTIAKMII